MHAVHVLTTVCLCGAGDDDEEEDGDDDEEEDGDDGSDTEVEAYAVESIVSHRGAGKKREYLVKWVGWTDPTWQPMRDFVMVIRNICLHMLLGLLTGWVRLSDPTWQPRCVSVGG